MAFTVANLHQRPYVGIYKEFVYNSTGEAMGTIVAANYISSSYLASDFLATSDRVHIYASDGEGLFKVGSGGTTGTIMLPVGRVHTLTANATSTATAINPFGVTYLTSTGAVNYLIGVPGTLGDEFTVIYASTYAVTLTTTGSVLDGNGTTNTSVTFATLGDAVRFVGVVAGKWAQTGIGGTVVGTTVTALVYQPSS